MRKTSYPSDVTDEEWEFCAPYLQLMKEEALQRRHGLREVLNAVRYLVRAGCPWRMIPNDFPPVSIVYQQAQRWLNAGCTAALRSSNVLGGSRPAASSSALLK